MRLYKLQWSNSEAAYCNRFEVFSSKKEARKAFNKLPQDDSRIIIDSTFEEAVEIVNKRQKAIDRFHKLTPFNGINTWKKKSKNSSNY